MQTKKRIQVITGPLPSNRLPTEDRNEIAIDYGAVPQAGWRCFMVCAATRGPSSVASQ